MGLKLRAHVAGKVNWWSIRVTTLEQLRYSQYSKLK